jgi:hypothetical protein
MKADPTTTKKTDLKFVGWQQNGLEIDTPYGYDESCYWDADGKYLGPDADGIEPLYEEDFARNAAGRRIIHEAAYDYRDAARILKAEGFSVDDIDAAINSLIDSGLTYADEDDLVLTNAELGVLRRQLSGEEGTP